MGGRARARFWTAETNASIAVMIESPERGVLEWNSLRYDGCGPIPPSAREGLMAMAREIPSGELALIPLDVACRSGAEGIHPAVGAALLMPFQTLLKYATSRRERLAAIHRVARRANCQYLRLPLDDRDPSRTPSPSVASLSFEPPIPMALGFFPFDGEGEAR